MTERTTPEQRTEQAKAFAFAEARRAGKGEPEARAAAEEAGELAADPGYNRFINDMENRRIAEEEKDRRERVQHQNRAERELSESLEARRKERFEYFRQAKRPGLSEEEFNKEIWPALRRDYLAGRPDAVDRERLEKSDSVF